MKYCLYFLVPVLLLFVAAQGAMAATNEVNKTDVVKGPPVAPDIVFPVTVTTNAAGVPVHHFSMTPTITNMVAATNDLAVLKGQLEAIETKMKMNGKDGEKARDKMRDGYSDLVGVMTNFPSRNADAKKMHDRIKALESELKGLRAEYQKKLDEDEAYKLAKSKLEEDRDAFKKFEDEKDDLRKKRMDVGARVWQLQTMVDRIRQTQEAELKAKNEKNKASAP